MQQQLWLFSKNPWQIPFNSVSHKRLILLGWNHLLFLLLSTELAVWLTATGHGTSRASWGSIDGRHLLSVTQTRFISKCWQVLNLSNFEFSWLLKEGDIGVCGVAVLLSFLCGIPVNKIPHCGVAVISNPTVCDVCAFKPTVFGETKLFAVSRHQ